MHQLPDQLFVSDGTGPGMVRAGEPRLRRYSRPVGDGLARPAQLGAALARLVAALRLPESVRVATSR